MWNVKEKLEWQQGQVVSSQATDPGCLIQSDFRFDSAELSNFEVVVLEGATVY